MKPRRERTAHYRLIEVLLAFGLVSLAAALLFHYRPLAEYFHAIVAGLFLYVPAWLLWRDGHELEGYGLGIKPVGTSLIVVGLATVVLLPAFGLGFLAWQKLACSQPSLWHLAPGPCVAGQPAFRPFELRGPVNPGRFIAAELLVVALPEEFFFRGFVQGRLGEVWTGKIRLLGAEVGFAWLAQAVLFALSHWVVQGDPSTLAVFFPGLVFGWIRARTGSIFAGTLFHALCNISVEMLHRSFFG